MELAPFLTSGHLRGVGEGPGCPRALAEGGPECDRGASEAGVGGGRVRCCDGLAGLGSQHPSCLW